MDRNNKPEPAWALLAPAPCKPCNTTAKEPAKPTKAARKPAPDACQLNYEKRDSCMCSGALVAKTNGRSPASAVYVLPLRADVQRTYAD